MYLSQNKCTIKLPNCYLKEINFFSIDKLFSINRVWCLMIRVLVRIVN